MEITKEQSYPKQNPGFFRSIIYSFQANPWLPICIILVIGVLLRLPRLSQSLWHDELWSTNIKLGSLSTYITTVGSSVHPPFYNTFMFFWIRLFGDSEISIRIPPFIFGISSILLVYILSLKYLDRKAALLAAFLLAVSPVHIWYSQEATSYSAVMFFLLVLTFSYFKIEGGNTKRAWYLLYFCSLYAAALSHYSLFAYLIVISVICFSGVRRNRHKQKILICNGIVFGVFCLFILLKVIFAIFPARSGYLRPFTLFEWWMLFFNWFTFGNSIWNIAPYGATLSKILQRPAMFYSQIFFLTLFLSGLILNCKSTKGRYGWQISLFLFSIPLLILGISSFAVKRIYIERGAFACLPFFYMTLARGATGLKNRFIKAAGVIIVVIFSITALFGFLKKEKAWTVYKQNPGWRAAADYFIEEAKDTAGPFLVFQGAPSNVLYYYFRRRGIGPVQMALQYFDKSNIHNEVLADDIKIFYLIENKYWGSEYFKKELKRLKEDSRFYFLGSRIFKGIEIFKFKVVGEGRENDAAPGS